MVRSDGQKLIDQGEPTTGLEQRDWEFFKTWRIELVLQEQRQRVSEQPAGKKLHPRQTDDDGAAPVQPIWPG